MNYFTIFLPLCHIFHPNLLLRHLIYMVVYPQSLISLSFQSFNGSADTVLTEFTFHCREYSFSSRPSHAVMILLRPCFVSFVSILSHFIAEVFTSSVMIGGGILPDLYDRICIYCVHEIEEIVDIKCTITIKFPHLYAIDMIPLFNRQL